VGAPTFDHIDGYGQRVGDGGGIEDLDAAAARAALAVTHRSGLPLPNQAAELIAHALDATAPNAA
jgi:hypothetical protein